MKQHELIRKLRLNRNLSQEFLASGITTRESITRFESRGTSLSSDKLFLFLDKMNVSPEEYFFLLNEGNITSKQELNLEGGKYLHNLEQQIKFLQKLDIKYFETNDVFYQLIKFQYTILYAYLGGDKKLSNYKYEKDAIFRYLTNIEEWGRFELSLFINLLFIFDSLFILSIFNTTIKKMKIYVKNPYYKMDLSIFLTNSLILFWERADFFAIDTLLPYLDELTQDVTYCSDRFTYLIFKKVVKYKENFSTDKIQDELNLLKYLGYEKVAKKIQQYF